MRKKVNKSRPKLGRASNYSRSQRTLASGFFKSFLRTLSDLEEDIANPVFWVAMPQLFLNCKLLQFDFNVDTRWQVQLHQGVHCFVCGVNDVHQTLVRADFELVTAGFVDVR